MYVYWIVGNVARRVEVTIRGIEFTTFHVVDASKALDGVRELVQMKADFIEENTDDDGDWDVKTAEGIADYDSDIADAARELVKAIRRASC